MCSIGEEPPPLVDPTKKKPKTPSKTKIVQKLTNRDIKTGTGTDEASEERDEDEYEIDEHEDSDADRFGGYYDDDGEFIWDDDENEDEDSDEDEYEDEEGDEYEDEYDDEEEEEEDSFEDEDELCDPTDKPVCIVRGSDAGFKESDLEDRKKRRYIVAVHSFLELADPDLDKALEPGEEEIEEDECGTATGYSTGEERQRKTLKEEKQKYRDLCKELGVKPDPKVLANLRNPVMDLSNMGMNAKEITAVCRLLETNTHVQWLSLAGNTAGKDGGMAIAELILKNKTINTYILSGMELLEAFDAICDAIAQNSSIIQLNFSKNDLEDIDMPGIRKILRGVSPLQILNLNANLIKDDGLKNIGQGLFDNKTVEELDLSNNKFIGDKQTGGFFNACAEHPELKYISLRRNFIGDDGGKGFGRILTRNPKIEELDLSFNRLGDNTAAAIGRGLNRKNLSLKKLLIELQRFREKQAALILKPMGNLQLNLPIELVDFGMMLDIHTEFIKAKEKALKAHPEMKIIHGQTYGLEHAKGPDLKQLVIRKGDAVCQSFETPLVMLMEELAKEKPLLTQKEFRKFIKQCNLYKDKTLTEAFEKVFEKEGHIDGDAILEAFDKEYPGLRKIPEPDDEEEEETEVPKKEKKKKGKGKGKGKGKKGGDAGAPKKGKGGKKKK